MQFTLRTLLLLFLLAWSTLAALGVWGLVVVSCFVLAFAGLRSAGQSRFVAAVISGSAIFFGLCLAPFSLAPPPGKARGGFSCHFNLWHIALGFHNYHDAHRCFPPAYVPGPDGTPWHSWRVLILPYLEQQALYDQYDFSEPWDGPNNSKLTVECPREFLCPSDPGQGPPTTNYLAVAGPDTAWPGTRGIRLDEIDDPENTILLVEVAESGIHWMEPRDLTLEEALRGVQSERGRGISSWHWPITGFLFNTETAAQVVMADGTVRVLTESTLPDTLESLLKIGDGRSVPEDWDALGTRPNWSRWVSLATMLLSVVLLTLSRRMSARAAAKGSPSDERILSENDR